VRFTEYDHVVQALPAESAFTISATLSFVSREKARSTSWGDGSGCGFICVGAVGALSL